MNEVKTIADNEMALFLDVIRQRLSGSTVMSIEESMNIFKSINFTLHYATQEGGILQTFEQNKNKIKQDLRHLKAKGRRLKKLMILTEIVGYQSVFTELEIFFKTYDIAYAAHETGQASFDYQLAHPINDTTVLGINFVTEYITRLEKEALFMSLVPPEITQEILNDYKDKMPYDYKIDINNLYEIIFNQVITKQWLNDKTNASVLLTSFERKYLLQLKEFKISPKVWQLISSDYYYQLSYEKLIQKIKRKLKNQLLVKKEPYEKETILPLIAPMTQTAFNQLIVQFEHVSPDESIRLIASKVHSPYDLVEILEQYFFSNDDWQNLYKGLPLPLIFQLLMYLRQQHGEQDLYMLLANETISYKLELYKYIQQLDVSTLNEMEYFLKQLRMPKENYD